MTRPILFGLALIVLWAGVAYGGNHQIAGGEGEIIVKPADPVIVRPMPGERRPWLERMIGAPPPNVWYWPPRYGAQGPRDREPGTDSSPGNGSED